MFEKPDAQRGGQETGQAGGHAAGDPGIASDPPVGAGNIALNSADQSRQNTRERIKKQTRRQRSHVADIQEHLAVVHGDDVGFRLFADDIET